MAGKSRQETPHLRVRIEPRLLARLEKAREMNGRTLTGEIVQRLEESFRRRDRFLLSLVKPKEPKEGLLSLMTEPKEDSK
jgi:hypothetical protein